MELFDQRCFSNKDGAALNSVICNYSFFFVYKNAVENVANDIITSIGPKLKTLHL